MSRAKGSRPRSRATCGHEDVHDYFFILRMFEESQRVLLGRFKLRRNQSHAARIRQASMKSLQCETRKAGNICSLATQSLRGGEEPTIDAMLGNDANELRNLLS
jgi:hypothetical protein